MKLAVLGGSFNPPHIGHLSLAEDVRAALGYDKVLFVPVNVPPHKRLALGASDGDRIAMLNLAVEGNPHFAVDTCEIERGGVSYTIDTIRHLQKLYARQLEGKIGFILGDDLAEGFSQWHNAQELADEADLILVRRNAARGEKPAFAYRHFEAATTVLPVSSSEIRAKIAQGLGWRYLVPKAVYRYIVDKRLYE